MKIKTMLAIVGAISTILAAIPPLVSTLRPPLPETPTSVVIQGNGNIYAPGGTVHATTNIFNTYVVAWRDGLSTIQEALGLPLPISSTGMSIVEPKTELAVSTVPATQQTAAPSIQSEIRQPYDKSAAKLETVPRLLQAHSVTQILALLERYMDLCKASKVRGEIESATELSNELNPAVKLSTRLCQSMLHVDRLVRFEERQGGRELERRRRLDLSLAKREHEAAKDDPNFRAALATAIGDENDELQTLLLEAAVLDQYGFYLARDLLVLSLRDSM